MLLPAVVAWLKAPNKICYKDQLFSGIWSRRRVRLELSVSVILPYQVYKYREHIFFLQQKFKQDGSSPQPSSPMFDTPSSSHGNSLSRLYGSTATQYINEMLLQGAAHSKFPTGVLPEGKRPGPGKQGDGGKQWQYQQVRIKPYLSHPRSQGPLSLRRTSRGDPGNEVLVELSYVTAQRVVRWLSLIWPLHLHLYLFRSQWPLGRHGHSNPLPPFDFVFSFPYSVAKLQPCPTLLLSAPSSSSLHCSL